MLKILQNKWLIAILLILGIAAAGVFLLMAPPSTVERKGISLDRDKLPQRQKQAETQGAETKPEQTAPQREPVGSVTQLKGMAFADFEKEKRVLEDGSPIFQGDRIVTGAKARVILKMKDDAVIALGEDSEFLVQEYAFKVKPDGTVGEDAGNKGEVKLNKGVAKFASGRLGKLKSKPFHLVTPVATMGVRGTEGYISLKGAGGGQEIEVVSLKDEVLVWMEEVSTSDLDSSSGEIAFFAALISDAEAADLGREPETVKKNQMLSAAKGKPPVVAPAPVEKLKEAHTSTVVRKLPPQALQALAKKVAQSLVDSGAAASVEEAQKLLEESPEALDKMVETAEDSLMQETEAKVEAALESEKQIGKVEEEIKAAEASGDTAKLAELNDKKAALESKALDIEAATSSEVDEKASEKALEKTTSKAEEFSKDVAKAVAEGKSLQEVIGEKAKEVKEERKEKAKALGVEDYDKAKKAGETAKESTPKPQGEGDQKAPSPSSKDADKPTAPADSGAGPDAKPAETTQGGDKVDGQAGPGDSAAEGEAGGDAAGDAEGETKSDVSGSGSEGDKGADTPPPVKSDTAASTTKTDPASIFAEAAKGASSSGSAASTPAASTSSTNDTKSTFNPTPVTFNKPPVMVAQKFTIDENKPASTIVGTLAASDPDKGNTLVYTLTPSDVFTVDAATGVITAVAPLDFEKLNSYLLTATVTDNVPDNTKDKKITTITASITINVGNVNEAPTVTLPGGLSVDEESPLPLTGIVIADPDFAVPDGGTAAAPGEISVKLDATKGILNLTDLSGATISGGSSGSKSLTLKGTLVALNAALAKVTYAPEKDFNGQDGVTVGVDDLNYLGSGGPLTAKGTVTITVKPVNDAPVFTKTDLKFTVDENKGTGFVVGAVVATDIENEVITYEISKGNTGNVFAINAATGEIAVNKDAKLDYEKDPVFTLEVIAKDGGPAATLTGQIPAKVTIEVVNLNEPPTLVLPASVSVLEDTVKALSDIVVDDPDLTSTSTQTLKLTLSVVKGTLSLSPDHGNAVRSLAITDTLATIRRELGKLNYQGDANYFGSDTLTVTLDDQGNIGSGASTPASGTVAIVVVPVNDDPVITPIANVTIDEDKATNTLTFQVSDGDNKTGELTVKGVSSNTDLIPADNIVIAGTETDRTIVLTPVADRFGESTITLTLSDSASPPLTAKTTFKVTVRPVADKPVVTAATTTEDVQTTSGLVISRNSVDGDEVTHYRIANIVNGKVFKKESATAIEEGEFITVAEGAAGLKFTPSADLNSDGAANTFGFDVTGATSASATGVGLLKTTAVVSVTGVNDAPITTAGGVLNYTENQAATPFDTTFTITDIDNASMTGATVTISSGYQNDANGADILAFTATGSITGSWNATTGVLTLTGSATKASYVTALKSITYYHQGDYPSTAVRIISTTVSDGTASSAVVTSTVNMTVANDPPVLTAPTIAITYTEDDSPTVSVDPGAQLTLTDAESNQIQGATVVISGVPTTVGVGPSDTLIFTAQNGITGTWNAATLTMTLTGTTTVANYQAALRSITYSNTSQDPGDGTRTLTWTVTDTGGGTASSVAKMSSLTVAAVNDTPELTAPTAAITYTEDVSTAVSIDPDSEFTISDPDSKMQGATVVLSGVPATEGVGPSDTLYFTTQNGITGTWNAATLTMTLTGTTTLANYQTALRSITYSNTSQDPGAGTRTLTWTVTDASGGLATSAAVTSQLTVVAVNDAPAIVSGGTMTYTENAAATVVHSAITVTDVDNLNASSATIKITGSNGTTVYPEDRLAYINSDTITGSWNDTTKILTLTGVGATVAQFQTALASVTYANYYAGTDNLNDNPTAGTRKVSFTVSDMEPLASTTATASITVVAVNDPPVLNAPTTTITYTEDETTYTEDSVSKNLPIYPSSQFAISDLENSQIQGATVVISGVPATTGDGPSDTLILALNPQNGITGTWNAATLTMTLTGTTTLDNYQTALRSITYSNESQDPGAGTRTLTWTVTDADGGSATSTAVTSLLTVVAVNDPPVLTAPTAAITYTEDVSTTLSIDPSSQFTITDSENSQIQGATVVISGVPATTGDGSSDTLIFTNQNGITGTWDAPTLTMTLTGTATRANYQTALRSITYSNTSQDPGDGIRTLTWTVTDVDGGTSTSVAKTSSLTVVAVNDAPVLTAPTAAITYTEDVSTTLSIDPSSQFTITDSENSQIQGATVVISGVPATTGVGPSDTLYFTTQNGITGDWDAPTLTMTLTGPTTLANYQTALRSITYSNTSQDPGDGTRTLTWTVTDADGGTATSVAKTSSLAVVAVNDAPVLAGGGTTLAYTEDSPSENHSDVIDTSITITDVEGSTIAGATVTISTNYKGTDVGSNIQDALSYAGNGTNINAGVWNAATGVLTLTTTAGQTATLADYMTAFANVKYTNTSDAPDVVTRTITWQVTDVGAVNASSSTVTSSVNVTKTNDTPSDIALNNLGAYAASPVGTVIGSMTTTDPDLTTDTYTYTITSGGTNFAVANGKDISVNIAGDLVVNNAALSTGVYSVTVRVTDGGSATFDKTFSITVVAAPFTSGNMTTVGDANAVATLTSNAKTLVNSAISNLLGATPTSVTLTEDNLRTMILAKLNQQLWGSTSGLENIGTIIDMMGVTVTNAPQIQVTMRVKALTTLYARLPTSVQSSFKSLVDTISPYGSGYTFDLRLTVVPSVTGTTITYNNASSKLEVLHLKMLPDFLTPSTPYSIALDTLIASYNGVLTSLKDDGSMVFFLGDPIPKHVVTAVVGSTSSVYEQMATTGGWTPHNQQIVPASGASHATVRSSATVPTSGTGLDLGHYLPGKISGITFNTGSITLTP
ncbi:MAG: tandem-95 repeat protein [Magnetococcales bacterium]|nr:tandem-95 repeat protein [Magnetococcales bacterium]